jgi:hypothetical protein
MLLLICLTLKGAITITPTPPTPSPSPIFTQAGDSGGRYNKDAETRIKEEEERIKIDDDIIFQIIKTWAEQCQ